MSRKTSSYGRPGGMAGGARDEKGRPLRNYFGLKLFFGILEILTFCICNPITTVLGIFGCMYAAKANTAWREGNMEEFRTNSHTSSMCLWAGLAVTVVYLVLGILGWLIDSGVQLLTAGCI